MPRTWFGCLIQKQHFQHRSLARRTRKPSAKSNPFLSFQMYNQLKKLAEINPLTKLIHLWAEELNESFQKTIAGKLRSAKQNQSKCRRSDENMQLSFLRCVKQRGASDLIGTFTEIKAFTKSNFSLMASIRYDNLSLLFLDAPSPSTSWKLNFVMAYLQRDLGLNIKHCALQRFYLRGFITTLCCNLILTSVT